MVCLAQKGAQQCEILCKIFCCGSSVTGMEHSMLFAAPVSLLP